MAKIRTICIDTLTAIQTEAWMTSEKKPGHDDWMDTGKGIWQLASALQDRGFYVLYILGEPGTGKSTGMRTFLTKTNIWFNVDNKNPVWVGGKQEYGNKNAPTLPYHVVPKSYAEIINHVDVVQERGLFEEEKFAILTAHIEDYKSGALNKKRLKTIGKVSTKMQLESKAETVLYAEVINNGSSVSYILATQNDGTNTARSPMGLFEPMIENDYNFVINKLLEY